uniref:Reverse transcriptase domain-containing protein n=1 Tax=Tanacetum cinerariifolium TaxID=118510 RepID=A0A6L2JIK9_TANCI|nr:reverse transcriptase domain-containing protein [Tanacetum cinerariifolium]
MSAMENTTPLVTTVTKPATNPRDADATPRVNIQEFYKEYYEDILPIIMDKVRRGRRKDVHTRLDFGEGPKERTREDSHHSSARATTTKPERLKVQDRLRYGDRHDHPRGRSHPHRLYTSNEERPKDRERFRSVRESYDDSFSHSYRDKNRSRHMKRRRDNESPLSSVSKSDSSDGRTRMPNNVKTYDGTGDPEDHVKIFQAAAHVERWAMPTWCHMFNSTLVGAAMVWFDELPPESIDSYKDLKAAFLAYFMQQKKYVKDPVEIHNIKQKDGETIEDFMKRFKVETGRMKGAPECMWISGFMHGVNNPELTKRLNEHVPKTMEEMMITTTAFIRGEAAAASKKKGHSTDECMQLKKQIEELVRAGKLSHLIKQIKHGRDQSKTGKKETTAKDKPTAIYMIQSWQRATRQKVTQSFERVKEITFPPQAASSETEGPLVIEAEMSGHMIHRIRQSFHKSVDEFHDCKVVSHYNGIIGRPRIRAIQAVPSTVHGMLKFPVEEGIVTIRSTILIPIECTSVITSSAVSKEERTRPDNFNVALYPDFPDQEVAIRGTLSDKGRTKLYSILKKNLDIFSWQASDMTGVRRSVAEHRLNIREGYSPVRQKKRGQAPERAKAIQAEVQKLVEAGIMREVYYHDWLSNPVMTAEAEQAFKQLKQHLSELPLLVAPKPKEELIIYLSATYGAISAVLMTEKGATQTPIYFISRALQGLKLNYTPMEKLVLSLVFAAKRLRRTAAKMEYHARRGQYYVHAKNVDQRTDLSGFSHQDAGRKPASRASGRNSTRSVDTFHGRLIMYGRVWPSNNEAEYEALIAGLQIAARMGVKNVHVSVDSKLVANQVLGTYVTREDNMVKYLDKVKSLVRGFTNFLISQVQRSKNKKADALSKIASTSFAYLSKQVVVPCVVVKMCWTVPGGGINIAGPFPEGPGKVNFLIVPMDYFTKWIEAKAVATITGVQVKRFVWDNIVCRFGLPGEIVSDNGKQFSDNPFKDWCGKINITQRSASVNQSQSNGLIKRANRKIGMPTYRTAVVDIISNDEELRLNLDRLEERHERATIYEAKAKSKMTKYYNARFHDVTFRPSDFVYRGYDVSHAVAGGKLGPKWEGPYEVT